MADWESHTKRQAERIKLAECITLALGQLSALQETIRHAQAIVGRGTGGREIALAQTKLDEARLWLGEVK